MRAIYHSTTEIFKSSYELRQPLPLEILMALPAEGSHLHLIRVCGMKPRKCAGEGEQFHHPCVKWKPFKRALSLIQSRNLPCPQELLVCLSGILGLVPHSPVLFYGKKSIRSTVIFAALQRSSEV